MDMSISAARALEQVKLGLAILYGANYFTEDEWVKIDSLIRNKQYGSTPGQPCHILDDEEPLISFPDFKHNANVNIQDTSVFPSKSLEKDAIIISEKEIQLPVRSEPAATTTSVAEDLIGPFTEACSDNENTPERSTQQAQQFRQVGHPQTSSSYNATQAGISPRDLSRGEHDQVMTTEAESIREGQSSLLRHASAESSGGEASSPDLANASERTLWTPSSVTDVDSDGPPSSAHSKSWNHSYPGHAAANIAGTNDNFRIIDDCYKVNKPTRVTKSLADSFFARDASSGEDRPAPSLEVTPGTILVAQCSFPKTTKVHVDVCAGDSVKVMKKVSGIMYHGENLRTKTTGQFPSSIFQKSSRERRIPVAMERLRSTDGPHAMALTRDTSLSRANLGNDLDRVEGLNAAEWDKDDASVATAPVTVTSSTQESVGRKDSALAALDDQSQCSDATQQEMMRVMMSRMLDEKLQNIQNARKKATSGNRVSSCHSEARNSWTEPLKSVAPKTQICWFFATPNKECRFTAEECRDLHEFFPSKPGDNLNLRMGKPTWGALADYSPPLSSNESLPDPKGREKTCWYWANTNCEYSADTCRFLHKHTPAGVMTKPGDKKWKRGREGDFGQAGAKDGSNGWWNEVTPDELEQQAAETQWLESPPEKYKPPHVKALEEKEQMKSAGWW